MWPGRHLSQGVSNSQTKNIYCPPLTRSEDATWMSGETSSRLGSKSTCLELVVLLDISWPWIISCVTYSISHNDYTVNFKHSHELHINTHKHYWILGCGCNISLSLVKVLSSQDLKKIIQLSSENKNRRMILHILSWLLSNSTQVK